MSFAKRLAALRKSRGLSQIELAELIGVSHGTIGNYEAGKRTKVSKPILQALAGALQVSISDLLDMNADISLSERMFGEKPRLALYGQDGTISEELGPEEYEEIPQQDNTTAVAATPDIHIQKVVQSMKLLNENGQKEAVKQIELLTRIPEFKLDT